MRTFEDWVLYIYGGLAMVGMAVTGRVMKVQDEHANKINEHAETIAELRADRTNMKATLASIDSKLDRVIEREHGA